MIEFYGLDSFRKDATWIPPGERGEVIEISYRVEWEGNGCKTSEWTLCSNAGSRLNYLFREYFYQLLPSIEKVERNKG